MNNLTKFLLISFTIHAGLLLGFSFFSIPIQDVGSNIKLAPGFQSFPVNITDVELIKPEDMYDDKNDDIDKNADTQETISYSIGVQSSLNKGLPNPVPEYPAIAVRWGWEGAVHLKFKILKNGHVDEVKIIKSSGYPIMDNAAKSTVETWKFPKQKKDIYKEAEFIFKINR